MSNSQTIRVEIQDLQEGDVLIPSGRIVLANSVEADTPIGYRVVHLKNASGDGSQRYSFEAHNVINVHRVQ
jgi:hypothetical protein